MMKGILEFNRDSSEDEEQFQIACKARNLWLALLDIQEYLHKRVNKEGIPDKEFKILREIFDEFDVIITDRDVTLRELS